MIRIAITLPYAINGEAAKSGGFWPMASITSTCANLKRI